jgi:hypothetical protein
VNARLDTHGFIWWDQRRPALNTIAGAAIKDAGDTIFVSAASVWEIAIKRRRGKLTPTRLMPDPSHEARHGRAGHLARHLLKEMAGSVAGHDGRATACIGF